MRVYDQIKYDQMRRALRTDAECDDRDRGHWEHWPRGIGKGTVWSKYEDNMAEAESDSSLTAKLSGTEKSAILMMLLGEEQAAEIFQNLSPREVQHLDH